MSGGLKSLGADGSETAGEAFSRAGSKSVQIGEDCGSACGESRLHGHLGAGESRWNATSPAHPLAVAVHERIDAKAFLHRRSPTQPSGLSPPFLPKQREHRVVCLALHAGREKTEIPDVVAVAIGDVVGERARRRGSRAGPQHLGADMRPEICASWRARTLLGRSHTQRQNQRKIMPIPPFNCHDVRGSPPRGNPIDSLGFWHILKIHRHNLRGVATTLPTDPPCNDRDRPGRVLTGSIETVKAWRICVAGCVGENRDRVRFGSPAPVLGVCPGNRQLLVCSFR